MTSIRKDEIIKLSSQTEQKENESIYKSAQNLYNRYFGVSTIDKKLELIKQKIEIRDSLIKIKLEKRDSSFKPKIKILSPAVSPKNQNPS